MRWGHVEWSGEDFETGRKAGRNGSDKDGLRGSVMVVD